MRIGSSTRKNEVRDAQKEEEEEDPLDASPQPRILSVGDPRNKGGDAELWCCSALSPGLDWRSPFDEYSSTDY